MISLTLSKSSVRIERRSLPKVGTLKSEGWSAGGQQGRRKDGHKSGHTELEKQETERRTAKDGGWLQEGLRS